MDDMRGAGEWEMDEWAEKEILFTWNELKEMFINEEWMFR